MGKTLSRSNNGATRSQRAIKSCKEAYYNAKVKNLKETRVGKWWKEIKDLSGVSERETQWHSQLVDGANVTSVTKLCECINDFFASLTAGCTPLSPLDVLNIHVDIEAISPPDFFVTVREAYIALRQTKVKKAPGPDGIPNIVLKEFAFELAPLIADMYNTSLCEDVVPPSLKHAIVSPLPNRCLPSLLKTTLGRSP